jgi:hypothetical protein
MEDLLRGMLARPPRQPNQFGELLGKFAQRDIVDSFNVRVNSAGGRESFELCVRAADALLALMCQSLAMLTKYVSLEKGGTWSTGMGVFVLMANLVVVAEDAWPMHRGAGAVHPWRLDAPATTLDEMLLAEVCVSDAPVRSYPVSAVVDAHTLLALRWHRIPRSAALRRYVLALIHRACILAAHPGAERAFDVPRLVEPCETGTGLWQLNAKGVCLVTQPLVRMLYAIDYELVCPVAPAPAPPDDARVENVRRYLAAEGKRMGLDMGFRRAAFARLFDATVLYGDMERFRTQRGIEEVRPLSATMAVRDYVQRPYAAMRTSICVDLVAARPDEREPGYADRWTRAEHFYAVIVKTMLLDGPLRDVDLPARIAAARGETPAEGLEFSRDYVVFEQFDVASRPRIAATRDAVLVTLHARLHVVVRGTLIRCVSVEHAFVVWALAVLNTCAGRIGSHSIGPALAAILDPPAPAAAAPLSAGVIVDD